MTEEKRASTHADLKTRALELAKMEGRHARQEEERERAKDKKRLKALFKMNAPEAVLRVAEAQDPTALRRRLPLQLPAPQVTDAELEDITRASRAVLMPPPAPVPGGRLSSAALLGDYSAALRFLVS